MAPHDPISDQAAVAAVVTEYFQAWFAGDGDRVRTCLHPALAKRTPREPNKSLALEEDPVENLVAETASGEGTAHRPTQEVMVLDVFRGIATAMVRSDPFVEYVHLARFGDRWLILNALYWELDGNSEETG